MNGHRYSESKAPGAKWTITISQITIRHRTISFLKITTIELCFLLKKCNKCLCKIFSKIWSIKMFQTVSKIFSNLIKAISKVPNFEQRIFLYIIKNWNGKLFFLVVNIVIQHYSYYSILYSKLIFINLNY